MRIISCSLQNFGSYKNLEFDFENQGLTLVQGATGSGKSTLMDAIPWILFGHTAKDGAADEVRSWNCKETTCGGVTLEINGTLLKVSRSRNPNDLILSENEVAHRGKDLNDTQKLINDRLGINCDLYLSGAYFHEFSQTAQFFSTTAKNRREICEQIVDLSLAKKLQTNTTEKAKNLKKDASRLTGELSAIRTTMMALDKHNKTEINKANRWKIEHQNRIKVATMLYDKFETSRKKTMKNKCTACGTVLGVPQESYDDSENPYLHQLVALEQETNPHSGTVKDFTEELVILAAGEHGLGLSLWKYEQEISDLDILTDTVQVFRGALVKNTISYIESNTNDLLTKYFDAEININLLVEDTSKVDVTITKDGNTCVYTQLSKGQRQLLKLCFAVSIMQAVQNHHGVKFNQLFFDEALDGLDETLKAKAYRLLEDLAVTYESVFVVEHSEGLKSMFPSAYKVELVNGGSQICLL